MSDVKQILERLGAGDSHAAADLLPLVYEELRKLAAQRMAGERADHTLQATALVHDAYLRLVDAKTMQQWDSKGHFFAAAAEAMRRILIDHARQKASLKRGGGLQRVDLTACDSDQMGELAPHELLELDEALHRLAKEDEVVAKLVELRLYAGMSVTEAALAMDISRTVAYQHWDYALAWFAVEWEEALGPDAGA